MAQSWEISDDRLRYTFHLRQHVRFHDGTELDAEDILFTYQQIIDPHNHSPLRSRFELVDRFEVVDRHTFRIVLKEPLRAFLHKLDAEIIPRHLLEGQSLASASFNWAPVGTGPFKFKSWDKRTDRIILEANPDYFEGRSFLDQITIQTYSNIPQVWAALMRREIDFANWLTNRDYMLIKIDSDFKAYAVLGRMYFAMAYDLKDKIWADRDLRVALAHGINIKEMIDALPGANGIACSGPFYPEFIGHDPEVKRLEYDPDWARAILENRGWKYSDHESRVRSKDSQTLELRMLVDGRNSTYKRMAAVIRQQLAQIGIKVIVVLYENEGQLSGDFLRRKKPQAWLRLYGAAGFEELDSSSGLSSWQSSSTEYGKLWDYENSEVDRLSKLAMATDDEKTQGRIYRQVHRIIYEDQPACFLFYPAFYFAVHKKFQNTDALFSGYMPYWTIKDWVVGQEK